MFGKRLSSRQQIRRVTWVSANPHLFTSIFSAWFYHNWEQKLQSVSNLGIFFVLLNWPITICLRPKPGSNRLLSFSPPIIMLERVLKC
jgi:hypothetical protein